MLKNEFDKSELKMVARGGIEPPTQGFSVLFSLIFMLFHSVPNSQNILFIPFT